MSKCYHANWQSLADMGVSMESSIGKGVVRVDGLNFETAVKLGHSLVILLDSTIDYPSMTEQSWPLEYALGQSKARMESGDTMIFGARPARANFGVSAERRGVGIFLRADIRNAYEAPGSIGRDMLQAVFIQSVESLDL